MTALGFLGLGTMGAAMAGRLLEQGHAVTVWNRSAGPVDALVAAGATRAATPEEALAEPVSFSMLANDEAAEAVLTAEAFAGQPGRIHVNTASVSPDAADRLAATAEGAGVAYVSAPVPGRHTLAAEGRLNIMAAGESARIDAVQPYLADLAVRTWRFGDRPRMAHVVKASVNYNIIHAIQALCESIALVEAHGVDGHEFVELLTNSLFGGVAYTVYGQAIADGRYTPPGFSMALGFKDLGLAEAVAEEGGVVLPSAPVLRELFEIALRDPELKDADWGGLAEVTRRGMAPPA
jgi:3-hydroxyisobutyrate dehydrogenase-like beta-hydroxyacid dehydrogenase